MSDDKPLDLQMREAMDREPVRTEHAAELKAAYNMIKERISGDRDLTAAIRTVLMRRAAYPTGQLLENPDIFGVPYRAPRLQGVRAGLQIALGELTSGDEIAVALGNLEKAPRK